MKAAVFYEPKKPLKVEEVETPKITSKEVLVRIKACGICGGDVQRVDGLMKVKTPIILGHEPAGIIDEVGSEVKGFSVGERVFIKSVMTCGGCYYCRIGRDNLCDEVAGILGITQNGCYAEYVKVFPSQLYKLPENVSLEAGAIISGPCGTAFHAVTMAKVSVGNSAVVYGTGCVGTLTIQILKLSGVKVIAVDVESKKLEMARKLGADEVINAREEDPVKKVKELTDGMGADVAFEVIGNVKTIEQAINSVRKGGTAVDVGSVIGSINLNMTPFNPAEGINISNERILMSVSDFTRSDATKLLSIARQGKINFDLGTAKAALDEVNKGFEIKRSGKHLRVLIVP